MFERIYKLLNFLELTRILAVVLVDAVFFQVLN